MISKNNNLVSIGKKFIKTGGKGAPIFEKFINSNEKFKILSFKKDIPDRLNVEFNYFLENSRHPTDIADGVKTYYQPLKKVTGDMELLVMIIRHIYLLRITQIISKTIKMKK